MAEHVLATCPTAQASWYDGVGHVPHLEAAKRFNRELAELARRTRAQSAAAAQMRALWPELPAPPSAGSCGAQTGDSVSPHGTVGAGQDHPGELSQTLVGSNPWIDGMYTALCT